MYSSAMWCAGLEPRLNIQCQGVATLPLLWVLTGCLWFMQSNEAVKSPFLDIFKRKYRPDLTMAVMMPFFQQFTGGGLSTQSPVEVLKGNMPDSSNI